jgi:hypothetical protein
LACAFSRRARGVGVDVDRNDRRRAGVPRRREMPIGPDIHHAFAGEVEPRNEAGEKLAGEKKRG